MLLSDGRIARFQSRSLRRKAAPTVTSFLLGLLRSTSLAYANFDARLCRLLKMTHYLNFAQTSKSGYTHPNLACTNSDFWVWALPTRPCHSEWSEAESNCEAAPNEVRWNLGRTGINREAVMRRSKA